MRKLLERLITIQKQVRPVWFPERDPAASPSNFNGFWGPWRKNPSNQRIIEDASSKIFITKKDFHGNGPAVNHTDTIFRNDAEFHSLLHNILKKVKVERKEKRPKKEKKTEIYRNEESRIKKSMIALFNEMEAKTQDKEGTSRLSHTKRSEEEKPSMKSRNLEVKRARRSSKKTMENALSPTNNRDSVSKVVKQSIEEKTNNPAQVKTSENTNDIQDSTFNNIIRDIEENSEQFSTNFKATNKARFNNYRRSEIPKPPKSREESILSALSKIFHR